jgi:endonuclease/exonuclease/phosphatase family metal-dependent hydrolase
VALGEDERDGRTLSETVAAYLVAALGDGDLTLQQLLEKGDALTFRGAPDPTPLLEATAALDDDRPRAGKVPVTILSYNVALLDAQIFGFIDYKRTPSLEERRRALPELVFTDGAEVICLQEVWREEDVESFTVDARALGYQAFSQPRGDYNDGVMIFLKSSAIAGGTIPTLAGHAAYGSQDGLEFFPGPGIKRGFIEVAFTHAQAGPTRAFCTHMQAFPENWFGRMRQARELGIAARTRSADDELVIVAGDLNAGPYYKAAEWQPPEGETQTQWFHNALSYPLLLAYADLVDAAVMGRPADDAASDVTLGDTIVNDAAASITIPGAVAGWCDETPATTLTATDCNSLYFAQYAGTEYPARLDHVHVRQRDDIVVRESKVVFTEKRRFADVEVEPSDHYGVRVELLVDPR